MDIPILELDIESLKIMIPSALIYPTISYLNIKRKHRKEKKDIWKDHFNLFLENDSQNIIGTSGGISEFDKKVSTTQIIPNFIQIIHNYFTKSFSKISIENILFDKNKNLIVFGGCEPSELAERAQLDKKLRFGFGIRKSPEEMIYHIKKRDIDKIRKEREQVSSKESMLGAVGDWTIVDRFENKEIGAPIKSKDGHYIEDYAIITYNKSYYNPNRDMLLFSGAREIGTYFSNQVFAEIELIRELHDNLHAKHIHNDPFQAVIRFQLEPYKIGTIPKRNRIKKINFIDISKIE
jgi:hypothetical protein